MKRRFLIPVILTVGFGLTLSFQTGLFPSLSTGLQSLYAQGSWEDKFWVFDAHMHPISSVYRRGGTIGEPNADPRFTLPLAEQGGLGASFFNTTIDEDGKRPRWKDRVSPNPIIRITGIRKRLFMLRTSC